MMTSSLLFSNPKLNPPCRRKVRVVYVRSVWSPHQQRWQRQQPSKRQNRRERESVQPCCSHHTQRWAAAAGSWSAVMVVVEEKREMGEWTSPPAWLWANLCMCVCCWNKIDFEGITELSVVSNYNNFNRINFASCEHWGHEKSKCNWLRSDENHLISCDPGANHTDWMVERLLLLYFFDISREDLAHLLSLLDSRVFSFTRSSWYGIAILKMKGIDCRTHSQGGLQFYRWTKCIRREITCASVARMMEMWQNELKPYRKVSCFPTNIC